MSKAIEVVQAAMQRAMAGRPKVGGFIFVFQLKPICEFKLGRYVAGFAKIFVAAWGLRSSGRIVAKSEN